MSVFFIYPFFDGFRAVCQNTAVAMIPESVKENLWLYAHQPIG